MSLPKRFPIELHAMKNLLAATCVAVLLPVLLAAPARAHDDARLHVHANGSAIHASDLVAAPVGWFARVPAPAWGIASLAVAATLLRRRGRFARSARA